jgi:hypothetical protein
LLKTYLRIFVEHLFFWGGGGLKNPWSFLLDISLTIFFVVGYDPEDGRKNRNIQKVPHFYILLYLTVVQLLKYIWWLALLHETWVTLNLIHIRILQSAFSFGDNYTKRT